MRKLLLGLGVVVVSFVVAYWAMETLWPRANVRPPALTEAPPLPPSTESSVMVVPVAVTLPAITRALEQAAPREAAGKTDASLGQVLTGSVVDWTMARGPMSVAGRPEGLTISTPLTGTFRLTGQIGSAAGALTGALGNLLGGGLGREMQNLTGRAFDQSANMRGAIAVTARPELRGNWRVEPNLAPQLSLGESSLTIAGVRVNVADQVRPLIERAVNEQAAALQDRLRDDPFLEQAARREWDKLCRSIPLGKPGPDLPDLWLELKPVRFFAAQPRIDAKAVTLTLGLQAQTRIAATQTQPICPFPTALELVPPLPPGKVAITVPIDLALTDVARLMALQLKGRTFPEDGGGTIAVTVLDTNLAAAGERLLISLRVKATEQASWFGLGAEATIHIWGKPVLDTAAQTLRLADMELAVESEAAFGLLGTAARAAIPYVQDALAENAVVDLKPFAANARESIASTLAEFRQSKNGISAETTVTAVRLVNIAFDAKTLRIVAEAEGNAKVTVTALPAL